MPCWGSQLAFRALRCQCATDQKWAWSVCHQIHTNHFKEAWIMDEALKSCSGLAVLTCHRWSVHRWSGGAFLLCGKGLCLLGCRKTGRLKADLQLWLRLHSAFRIGCIGLIRAASGESKGTVFSPCQCRFLCTTKLSNFGQERFWAVAALQELIRTWTRAQALNALYLGSEWQLSLVL